MFIEKLTRTILKAFKRCSLLTQYFMKKGFHIFLGFLIVFGLASCKGCKDAVNKVFPGVEIAAQTIEVSIPAVPPLAVSLGEFQLPPYYQRLNIDSAIRANTGGAFGISAVSSIKVKHVTVGLTDSDENNNLSNFESARVLLSSNSQPNALQLFNITFPNTSTSTLTHSPTDSPELLPTLKGGDLTYHIYGKARRSTSKSLTLRVSVIMTVK
jgi:hypothetical protein